MRMMKNQMENRMGRLTWERSRSTTCARWMALRATITTNMATDFQDVGALGRIVEVETSSSFAVDRLLGFNLYATEVMDIVVVKIVRSLRKSSRREVSIVSVTRLVNQRMFVGKEMIVVSKWVIELGKLKLELDQKVSSVIVQVRSVFVIRIGGGRENGLRGPRRIGRAQSTRGQACRVRPRRWSRRRLSNVNEGQ